MIIKTLLIVFVLSMYGCSPKYMTNQNPTAGDALLEFVTFIKGGSVMDEASRRLVILTEKEKKENEDYLKEFEEIK
jgi:hypothetical protein